MSTYHQPTLPGRSGQTLGFDAFRVGAGIGLSAGASILLGAFVARGYALPVIAVGLVAVALAVGITHWRWSMYGLLLYLPVSGIPVVLLYPHTTPAVLAKDFLFVIPVYAGFFGAMIVHREAISFRRAPIALFGLFAVIVIAQTLNPALPNILVGLIGMKVWLLYIPLYFVGYHLVADRESLHRLLKVVSLAAILPATIGIVEAVLIYGGNSHLVYSLYGGAASAVTQDFAHMEYAGGGVSRRIPSTFSFVTQYYTFLAAMISVTYGLWRGFLVRTPYAWRGAALWGLMIGAAFLSGARGAFVFVPFLVVLTLVIERGLARVASVRMLAPIAIFLGAATLFGAKGHSVVNAAFATARLEFDSIFVQGFRSAIAITQLGLGTGIDTNASRYAFSTATTFTGVAGTWFESWYVKALLELGIVGLAVVVALIATLIIRGMRTHRELRDPRLRAVSAAILAYLIWNAVYGIKGQYIDLDPTNVYFWLLAGVAAKLATIERVEASR